MKNFIDSKDEKITEKAFSQSLIISVVSILLCLVALCSMTYAWFTSETASAGNRLQSGYFDLTIAVAPLVEGEETPSYTDVALDATGAYTFADAGEYSIRLTLTPDTNVKGFCVITAGETKYSTPAIVNDNTVSEDYPTKNDPYIFTIETTEPNTKVGFEIKWGAPAADTISAEGAAIKVEATKTEAEDAGAED